MEDYLYGLSAKVECDILLIIDATYPDKITKHLKRKTGSTTVFARPKVMTNGKGNVVQQDGEFLTLLYDTLYQLAEKSNKEYSHWKSNPTLAQTLSWIQGDKMTCKAHQDFSDEAKNANGEKLVTRPVLDIASARKTGKLQFLQEYYQGQPPETETPTRMDQAKRKAKRQKTQGEGEADDVIVLSDSSDCDEDQSDDDGLFVRG
ncbi:hypothetical protein HII31_05873 [Pseudocercospora fuligena]|uniref:Uncharacterized protein n=1 Tax=Pseudocercospora fuligena TaxID=685502 RepID=A0A8H6RJR7_9PEZI|nr:hypothetical protein HII31_05873 [Pseudocercospora fuligena]